MAKSTMSRHSKTSRKPVTIDLDPSDVKPVKGAEKVAEPKPTAKTVPPAEPVGDPATASRAAASKIQPETTTVKTGATESMTAPRTKPAQESPRAETAQVRPGAETAPVTPRTKPAQAQSVPPSGSPSPAFNNFEKTMNSTRNNTATTSTKTTSISPWLAGLAGGVIVLLGATALQYSGYGLFSGATNQAPDPALTAQITKLEQQLSALQSAPQPDTALLARLEAAEKNATAFQAQIADLSEKLAAQPAGVTGDDSALRSELGALQEQVAALKNAVPETDNSGLEALTQRVTELDAKLSNTNTEIAQTAAALNNDDNAVKALQAQLSSLQDKLDQQAKQPDMAAIVAANGLKNAIDRGGSYNSELQTFTALMPDMAAKLQSLDAMAATGVPTLNHLATQFAALADDMVAAENKPGADAGVFDQLIGSVKGLVRSRPIGEIAGDDVGAVTARIEFALQQDDVQRAVAEWAKLPASAKEFGQNFYAELVARRDADALMASLIADIAQSKTVVAPAAE